jgi:hypothetical protein
MIVHQVWLTDERFGSVVAMLAHNGEIMGVWDDYTDWENNPPPRWKLDKDTRQFAKFLSQCGVELQASGNDEWLKSIDKTVLAVMDDVAEYLKTEQ